ncbi:uncharacterized protein LOC108705728 isoform X2 [Xenopus laevis]|uniref:Uncharacterized protein LOC108705728 isoform X2 n=1 Tax=Xenopus laevis TaxID=8355 RepID=A0A8J1LE25_XENLA|nr:uncharacterized protein LOC108705728 isoform X2 [Xenopus laevis]XP_041426908.1 uncharacterized protein LOC108705728 isoform X2 [Xenopus laevis]XP_041426909.1 uncharacterized protein LOC108705728 isoform X2 [Xenopus laevis]XP_041426910.1 uncharacterized protein LOC108705728 isoform X2 [Xenopus laevis]XP_041426911.1 uncharacterized protein LOC108705728 isoform X2 [Xenopus laevis]XP_041426912.1 uncharacterized protein LOC108705728 isoform X2 [Xenopus laevis]
MAQQDSGSVGSPGGVTGTPDRLHSDTTPPIFRIQTAGQRLRQKQIPLRHTRPRLSGNHTTRSSKGQRKRLLFQPLHGSQERRFPQTRLRPQGSQSLRQKMPFQNGIDSVGSIIHGRKRVHDCHRHQGRISSHTDPPSASWLPQILREWAALAVRSPSIRSVISSTHVYEGHGGSIGGPKTHGHIGYPLFGRPLGQGSIRTSNPPSHIPRPTEPNHTGLDDQLHQVETSPNSVNRVPGSHPRLQTRESLPATRQGRDPSEPNSISPGTPPHSPSSSHADSGHDGCLLPGDSVCTSPHQISSTHHPSTPTQRSNQPRSPDCHPEPSADLSSMVASPTSDISGKTISTPSLDGPNHRCQSTRVGRSRRPNHCTGPLDSGRNETAHQPPGAQSDTLLPRTHGAVAPGTTGADTVRQRDGRSLHKSSGRNQKSQCPQGSSGDPKVGRRQCSSVIRGPHSRRGQLDSRLSEQGNHRSRGMEPPPR